MAKDLWNPISLAPNGMLDTRSVPADIPLGASRWRENIQVLTNGKTRRRQQFERFYADFPGIYHNHDLHSQDGTREPPNLLFESKSLAGLRSLFVATPSTLRVLDESTGYWTKLITGIADSGYRWKAAVLQDVVVFANNSTVLYHALGSGTAQVIPQLNGGDRNITAARIVLSWSGFLIVMNVIQDGQRQTSRIAWSDFKLPLDWAFVADSLTGKQDLDYGDEILAAVPMGNFVYICTRSSIWKMTVAAAAEATFAFERVYNEPQNQTGCLVFPNTLISDGSSIRYLSSDTIYKFNQFLPAPERDDEDKTDYLHRACGVIYTDPLTKMSGEDCESPIAVFHPDAKEMIISWPSVGSTYNNWTLYAQTKFKTADVDPHGWLALANFRRTPAANKCNEVQDLIGVSAVDWAIKSIGRVLFREFVRTGADLTVDLDPNAPPAEYYRMGYNTVWRGALPLALGDREKLLGQTVELDHETGEQDVPCVVQLRIGNSYKIVDANSAAASCGVLWRDLGDRTLACPDAKTLAQLKAAGQRPDDITFWQVYEQGRYLYYEFTIRNADHTPAIGGDTFIAKMDFNAMALHKV